MELYVEGQFEGTWTGTLPSGHRATTFFNSILNWCYMDRDLSGLSLKYRLHTGDDVLIGITDCCVAQLVVDRLMGSDARLNPSKQSVGNVSMEFLRITYGRFGFSGYAPRSVSSLVSGDWTKHYMLDLDEYLTSLLRTVWNAGSRGLKGVGNMLTSTVKRRLPEISRYAESLLNFRMAYGNGPLLGAKDTWSKVVPDIDKTRVMKKRERPSKATEDYINNHVKIEKLKQAGIEIGRLHKVMQDVSYIVDSTSVTRDLKFREVEVDRFEKRYMSTTAVSKRKDSNPMEKIFPLAFFASRITGDELVRAYYALTGYRASLRELLGHGGMSCSFTNQCNYDIATRACKNAFVNYVYMVDSIMG
jgi:hypothetical protein